MKTKLILLICTTFLVSSCAVSKKRLSSDGEKVRILSKAQLKNCSTVDKVIGLNEQGSDELAQNHARNLAAELDANGVYFDEMVSTCLLYTSPSPRD